jgi:hypothetical protein
MATKAKPTKAGDIKVTHNLYDILGMTLMEGIRTRRLNPEALNQLTANIGIDLGSDYNLDIGYGQYMGDIRQDLKLGITKKF